MAEILLNYAEKSNSKPTQSGWNSFDVDYDGTYTFTLADFTTGTTPEYSDPEGDELFSVQIVTLPIYGTLELNSLEVIADEEILATDIDSGLLVFTPNSNYEGYTDSATTFLVSDAGSLEYNNTANELIFNISANEETGPSSTGTLSISVDNPGTYTFTQANFTTETSPAYADPEGDDAYQIKITSIPTYGQLYYNDDTIGVGDVVSIFDINAGYMTYTVDQDGDSLLASFDFSISDEGSGIFLSGGLVNITIGDHEAEAGVLIYGMSADNLSAGGTEFFDSTDLTHSTEDITDTSVSFSGDEEYAYFAYPSHFGSLSSIEDSNGFTVTDSFFEYTVDVTSTDDGWTEEYIIYRTKNPTTIENLTYNFYF